MSAVGNVFCDGFCVYDPAVYYCCVGCDRYAGCPDKCSQTPESCDHWRDTPPVAWAVIDPEARGNE